MTPGTVNETEAESHDVGVPWRKAMRLSVWFSIVMAATGLLFASIGYLRFETAGLVAALVAGLVCWLGGTAALWLAALLRGSDGAVGGVLGGMFLRAGLPFVFGLAAQQRGGVLADGGIFGFVLANYFVALLAETLMSLKLVDKNPAQQVARAV